jgi:hypothetical protein
VTFAAAAPTALADGFVHVSLDPGLAVGAAEAACRQAVRAVVGHPADTVAAAPPPAECGGEALAARLADPDGWSDVRVVPSLTDVVLLHTGGLPQSRVTPAVTHARQAVDAAVAELLRERGSTPPATAWALSGHLWYRPGSVMGWHTNTRVPGWRAYLTWVAEGGRSFFRFRDPDSGELVTSWDTGLDLRLFHLSATSPTWHTIWSGTERHSFGYRLVQAPPG